MAAGTTTTDMQWIQAIRVDSLPVGDATRVEHAGACIAIFNLGGRFYATAGVCTHAHAFLSEGYIDGQTIECPLHQGLFHIPTGMPLSPPVTERLKTYETKVADGYVHILVGGGD
ncbi:MULTISPECIES: non-heme iron oxygenase ferredoxin subunit [unclassified Mesorhizobium]|uniref:non-heme iron oxygenase ferredoxin subunit n=1 Tax=unclassified Mesorhizobium TaxID=325217 RepID=UPI001AECE09C|nr:MULTISPECIES: non-heme iron oxygenase ferredoxin subunit [unclassified Mesorhizobium]